MSKEIHNYTYQLVAPESEFSPVFVQYMANRMAVSFHKYGLVADAPIDAVASLRQRLERYLADGNTEWLVDAANFAMIEYMHPRHCEAHFSATSSDESPGRTFTDGSVSAKRNQ